MLSIVVAVLALIACVAGLLLDGAYGEPAATAEMLRGYDLVTLAIAVPALVYSMLRSRRGSQRAELVGRSACLPGVHLRLLRLRHHVQRPVPAPNWSRPTGCSIRNLAFRARTGVRDPGCRSYRRSDRTPDPRACRGRSACVPRSCARWHVGLLRGRWTRRPSRPLAMFRGAGYVGESRSHAMTKIVGRTVFSRPAEDLFDFLADLRTNRSTTPSYSPPRRSRLGPSGWGPGSCNGPSHLGGLAMSTSRWSRTPGLITSSSPSSQLGWTSSVSRPSPPRPQQVARSSGPGTFAHEGHGDCWAHCSAWPVGGSSASAAGDRERYCPRRATAGRAGGRVPYGHGAACSACAELPFGVRSPGLDSDMERRLSFDEVDAL